LLAVLFGAMTLIVALWPLLGAVLTLWRTA